MSCSQIWILSVYSSHMLICYIFVYVKHLPSFAHFFSCQPKKGPAKSPPFWQLVQFDESHFWAIQVLIGNETPKKVIAAPLPPQNIAESQFPLITFLFFCLVVIHCVYACIYDMYSGNKLAVLSSVRRLGLVLPIQMTGGSKPVAEAWKTCVHVKRSYSWLAPRGQTGPGRWFIQDSGLMTLRQQFKISRDQISRLKSLITR